MILSISPNSELPCSDGLTNFIYSEHDSWFSVINSSQLPQNPPFFKWTSVKVDHAVHSRSLFLLLSHRLSCSLVFALFGGFL